MRHLFTRSKLFLLPVIAAYIALGFLRDFIFVYLNFQLYKLYYKDYPDRLPPSLQFLKKFSYTELYYGKYLLTGAFTLAFFFLTWLTIKKLFGDRQLLRWTLYIHLAILLLAFIFQGYGAIFKDKETSYELSMLCMHALQSPVIVMFLVPLFTLAQRTKQH